jgi:hypothetical protein
VKWIGVPETKGTHRGGTRDLFQKELPAIDTKGEVVDDVRQLFELEMIESGDDARLREMEIFFFLIPSLPLPLLLLLVPLTIGRDRDRG